MNRKELVEKIAAKSDVTQTDVAATLTALSDVLADAVAAGDKVQLPGLFTLERVERAARTGRNPATGETMEIPAGHAAKITLASNIKNAAKGK